MKKREKERAGVEEEEEEDNKEEERKIVGYKKRKVPINQLTRFFFPIVELFI